MPGSLVSCNPLFGGLLILAIAVCIDLAGLMVGPSFVAVKLFEARQAKAQREPRMFAPDRILRLRPNRKRGQFTQLVGLSI